MKRIVKIIYNGKTEYAVQTRFLFFFKKYRSLYSSNWWSSADDVIQFCSTPDLARAKVLLASLPPKERHFRVEPLYETKVEEAVYADRTDEE